MHSQSHNVKKLLIRKIFINSAAIFQFFAFANNILDLIRGPVDKINYKLSTRIKDID